MSTRSSPPSPSSTSEEAPARGQDPGQFYGRPRRRLAATLAGLQRKYAEARARHPRKLSGTFVAPVDLPAEAFRTLRLKKVQTFVDAQQRMGWRLFHDRTHPILLERGACPAYDLRDGCYREGFREYVVSAWFTFPNPEPLRIELPAWFALPGRATAGDPRKG
jgi:hypothetical protein